MTVALQARQRLHRVHIPEDGWAADVLGIKGGALQELVAQAVVEGAIEARGTPVGLQHPEALHLIIAVHKQLRLIAINANQDDVLHDFAHVAANQLVSDSISERLNRGGEHTKKKCKKSLALVPQVVQSTSLHIFLFTDAANHSFKSPNHSR